MTTSQPPREIPPLGSSAYSLAAEPGLGRPLALGVTVVGSTSVAIRVIADAATTGWGSGLGYPLMAILLGPLLGGWLARRGFARAALLTGLGGLTAILAGATFTKVDAFGTLATYGAPYVLAGVVLGAVLVYAIGAAPTTAGPTPGVGAASTRDQSAGEASAAATADSDTELRLAGGGDAGQGSPGGRQVTTMVAAWAGTVIATPLMSAWLVQHTTQRLFLWIAVAALIASLVPTGQAGDRGPTPDPHASNAALPSSKPRGGKTTLLQLLLVVAVIAAAGPLVQPLQPTKVVDLVTLYFTMMVLIAFTLSAAIRARGLALPAVALVGVVLVGTGYQLTAQLQRVEITGVAPAFAAAGLLGALATVAAVYAPAPFRRGVLLAGPAVTLLGLLITLDIGGKPRFVLWSTVLVTLGVGATLGAGLRDLNRTTATLAGGLLVCSVVIGIKLAQGIRVLDLLTNGSPGGVMLHWLVPCAVLLGVAGFVGLWSQRMLTPRR